MWLARARCIVRLAQDSFLLGWNNEVAMRDLKHAGGPEAASECLAGGGEMGALMREKDWSRTPLGPVESWPQSLCTSVSICLNSSYALLIWWGPELLMLYNDAYREIIAAKHPAALGQPARECWKEIWHIVGPMLEHVLSTGEATLADDLLLMLERHGYAEECYFTFCYSAIRDESGSVGGVFAPVLETTDKVIGARRTATLRDLGVRALGQQQTSQAMASTADVLAGNLADAPFWLIYLLEGDRATLAGAAGITGGSPAAPCSLPLTDDVWPLSAVAATASPCHVKGLEAKFGRVPTGAWSIQPDVAMALPIMTPGKQTPAGVLVAAISPHRLLNESYRTFLQLVAQQVGAVLAEAGAREAERQRMEALAELDRAKTDFFSNVSHEFRTPLTLMLGPLEEALAGPEPALKGGALSLVHRSSLRLLRLVNALLDFSRIEAQRATARWVATDAASLTENLASTFRSAIERAGVRFRVECKPADQPVYLDPDMWEKVVLNLLSNAFKFTLHGEISVTTTQEGGEFVLRVQDTGIGIPAGELPRIFERFHRVREVSGRSHEGTGIGLALVKELVALQRGGVQVESEPGRGTRFTVRLPMNPPDAEVAPAASESEIVHAEAFVEEAARWLAPTDEGDEGALAAGWLAADGPPLEIHPGGRVLVADDNADMRDYLGRILEPHFQVDTVSNGSAALQSIRREPPDLLLADVMMPGLDGLSLLRALRADVKTHALPVILLSARADDAVKLEAAEAGVSEYLTKPFAARELLSAVRAQIVAARARRESQALYETLIQASPQVVWMTDRRGNIVFLNQQWTDLTGLSMDESLNDGWTRAVHPEDLPRLDSAWTLAGQSGLSLDTDIRLRRASDGAFRWHIVRGVPRRDFAGRLTGWAGILLDIHAIRETDEALRTAMGQLSRSMVETHHRVKNNLQLVCALIDLLVMSEPNGPAAHELRKLNSLVRAMAVVHDVLTQEARHDGRADYISAAAVLNQIVPLIRDMAGHRNVIANSQDARLPGRQGTALALVTNELALNALKHGTGDVEIRFEVVDGEAKLSVIDDGPGFHREARPSEVSGTGMYLVNTITRVDLRGSVQYGNRRIGHGAEVVVTIPLTEGEGVEADTLRPGGMD